MPDQDDLPGSCPAATFEHHIKQRRDAMIDRALREQSADIITDLDAVDACRIIQADKHQYTHSRALALHANPRPGNLTPSYYGMIC